MRRGHPIAAVLVAALAAGAADASAHGIGARGDLPIPKDFFIWAATLAVVLSFLIAAVMWSRPRLAEAAVGRSLGGRRLGTVRTALSPLVRATGMAAFIVVLVAAWAGPSDPNDNIAPVAVYVVFWVGLLWASALLGDVWRMLNPWDTVAMYASGRLGTAPEPPADVGGLVRTSHWPAAAGLFAFQWLELAYHEPADPRVLGIAISAYTVLVVAAAARYGRSWIQTGEAFTVLFGLAARISPVGRRPDGRLRLRVPFTGLAEVVPRRGTAAVVLVVIGGTTFDGISRTARYEQFAGDATGWARTAVATLAMAGTIAVVVTAYQLATALVARLGGTSRRGTAAAFAPSLVPIALAYSVAHYFSLLVFEGQSALRLASDPLGRGWDLFGTAADRIDYRVVGTTTIALVQTIAIVVGHAAAVALAHDRALERYGSRRAAASQIPMLVLMVGLTVTGLTLLLAA